MRRIKAVYTLDQLRALNCAAMSLVAPDGVTELSPHDYALQFYQTDIGPGLAEGGCTTDGGGGGATVIYRLILPVQAGFATGANYPNCSQANSSACDPRLFATLAEAVNYAYAHNEKPVMVSTTQEAWAIVSGTETVDASRILAPGTTDTGGGSFLDGISPTMLLVGAGVLLLVFGRRSS